MCCETNLCLAWILWKYGIPFFLSGETCKITYFSDCALILSWSLKVKCSDKSEDANKGEARKVPGTTSGDIRGCWLKAHLSGYICFQIPVSPVSCWVILNKAFIFSLSLRVFICNQIKTLIHLIGSSSGLNAIIFVKHSASCLVFPKVPNGSNDFSINATSNDAGKRERFYYESFHVYGIFVN